MGSAYRLVREDDDSLTLDRGEAGPLRIAKSGLSREKLAAIRQAGGAQGAADGAVASLNDSKPWTGDINGQRVSLTDDPGSTFGPATVDEQNQAMLNGLPSAEEGASVTQPGEVLSPEEIRMRLQARQFRAEEDANNHLGNPLAGALTPAPAKTPEQLFQEAHPDEQYRPPATGGPSSTQPPAAGAASTSARAAARTGSAQPGGTEGPPEPDTFGPEMSDVNQGLLEQQTAIQQMADLTTAHAQMKAQREQEALGAVAQHDADFAKTLEDRRRQGAQLFADATKEIDPDRYMKSLGPGAYASSLLGVLLSGLGSRGSGQNIVLDMLRQGIGRDIDAQKSQKVLAGTQVGRYLEETRDVEATERLARAHLLEQYAGQIQAHADLQGGQTAQAEAMKNIGLLRTQADQERATAVKSQTDAHYAPIFAAQKDAQARDDRELQANLALMESRRRAVAQSTSEAAWELAQKKKAAASGAVNPAGLVYVHQTQHRTDENGVDLPFSSSQIYVSPDPKDAPKVRERMEILNQNSKVLDALEGFIAKGEAGVPGLWDPSTKAGAEALRQILVLAVPRETTGSTRPPAYREMEVINKFISDPTSTWNSAWGKPRAVLNALRQLNESEKKSLIQSHGLRPLQAPVGGP